TADRHLGAGASRSVDRRVAPDPVEERYKRQAAVLVAVQRFHRPQEHVGNQVLRLVSRAGPRQAVAIDRVAIALVELTERGGIAGLGGFDERRVDTSTRRVACGRLAGDARVRDDLRAPGPLRWERR